MIFEPIVWMMRHPPASVPSAIAACADKHDPEWNRELRQQAAGKQHAGDDAHGLLRVVGAVAEAVRRGREQLQLAEMLSTRDGAMLRQIQYTATIKVNPSTNPITGARTMKISVLVQPDGISATMPTFATAAPA